METSDKKNRFIYFRWVLLRLSLVVFDIVAVNISYYLALLIRFYVNFELNALALPYVPAYRTFAPWYTICCLVIFALFKLYDSRWKYASLGDLNRILLACLVTCVVQVVGSVTFVLRMPITYYTIGAVIQFVLIAVSRFSYRMLQFEFGQVRRNRKGAFISVMIVGVGNTSNLVRRHLEQDLDSAARPVCLVDFRGDGFGSMMGGIPVVNGVGKIAEAVKKYAVECVILADNTMPQNIRKEIRDICGELNMEVQDFSGFFQDSRGTVTLRNLMEYTRGEVELVIGDKTMRFGNGEQAVTSVTDKYVIKSVSARGNCLVVELQKDILVPNDVKEEWVQTYKKETGEDVSFF